MSGNTFNMQRLLLLFKQHFIHNTQFMLLSVVAYMGVIFIVLSIAQIGSELDPLDIDAFQALLIIFIVVFGVLYVGHSFPAFRSKESTMNYLMVPASILEKFIFEFISRIGLILILLPLLYWITFHLQGYFFTMFTTKSFEPVGIQYLVKLHDVPQVDYLFWIYVVSFTAGMLGFSLAFTGAAMFDKQPLVKTVFAVAVLVMFYIAYSYFVVVYLGVGEYNPPESMYLIPLNETGALQLSSALLIAANIVILFVAYRKLKEREV